MEHRGCVFRFADVEVHEREFSVIKAGEVLPLEPKAFKVLQFFVHNPGRAIPKDELLDAVWNDCEVTENSLTRSIALLRRQLGDDIREPRYIATIPTVGYRFLCDVQVTEDGFGPLAKSDPNGSVIESRVTGAMQKPEDQPSSSSQGKSRSFLAAALGVAAVIVLTTGLLVYRAIGSRATDANASSHAGTASPKMRIMPLTNLPGDAGAPSFSPDGRQVAFFWNADTPSKLELYVQLVGGDNPLQLTHSRSGFLCCADWSPNGQEIAFGRCDDSGGAVFTVPALGGPERKLTDVACPFGDAGSPQWTRDGKSLVLSDRCTPDGIAGIVLFSLATGEKQCLHSPPPGDVGDFGPVLSPDGKTVAFLRSSTDSMSEIYTVALSGRELRQLTHDGHFARNLMWSSDGKRIVFKSGRNGSERPWQIPATGGPIEAETVYPQSGVLSRDGRRLAYIDYSRSSFSSAVWRADLSSPGGKVVGQTRILAPPRHYSGTQLSPDEHQIVYQIGGRNCQILKNNVNGGNPLQLTFLDKGFGGTPRWSPDGKWITFDYHDDIHSQIYVIDAEGRNQRGITSGNYENAVPSWSRDGSAIYFASNRTGAWQVWRRELSDGKETQMTRGGGFAALESYDARTLYYSRFEGGGLWSVPVAGGAEQLLTDALHRGDWGNFAVTYTGLYLVDSSTKPGPTILYYDFESRRPKPVLMLKQDAQPWTANLSASRDGRTLLYAQFEARNSIMMADNLQ
jgi:Tol biopolymer transport system component/DNA-binding winged helix-turn-helix (wHTH) protein